MYRHKCSTVTCYTLSWHVIGQHELTRCCPKLLVDGVKVKCFRRRLNVLTDEASLTDSGMTFQMTGMSRRKRADQL